VYEMPKKQLIALATILVLLLVTAQLALAQQDTTTPSQYSATPQQQYTSGAPSSTGGQTQPAAGSQSSPSAAGSSMHLNKNNELVINCPTVSSGSTQTDQQAAQLCADSGYKPADSSGGSTQYQ